MFFGTHTSHRIKSVLDLYGIGSYSGTGKFLLFITKLSASLIPLYFAYAMFDDFEFSFWNILKFIGWFMVAHIIYESVIISFIAIFLIRKKTLSITADAIVTSIPTLNSTASEMIIPPVSPTENLSYNISSFDFKNSLYKIYADLEFEFYDLDLSAINYSFVGDQEKLYDSSVDGIPTFFEVSYSKKNDTQYIYNLDSSKFKKKTLYAVFLYQYVGTFSTRAVATVDSLSLVEIAIYRKGKKKIRLFSKCVQKDIKEANLIR